MSARFEYRVRWLREGRSRRSQIIQTERGAVEKAERLVRLDEEKLYDGEWGPHPLADMPDLAESPTIERRAVDEWEPFAWGGER